MLIRLGKATRWRLAALLAVSYMLCVLAPAAAFAFGDGSYAAHCLTDNIDGLTPVHVHKHDGGRAHVHNDGRVHDHSKAPNGPGKSSNTQCCCLVCLSALPATLTVVHVPALPATIAVSASEEDVAGNGPDRLYRPPISLLSL
jgi:hypothetical protein